MRIYHAEPSDSHHLDPRGVPAEGWKDGEIAIRYGVAPSPVTGRGDRWAPVLEVNGRRTVAWRGLERDAALAEAKEMADDERGRYTGDWTITVRRLADQERKP